MSVIRVLVVDDDDVDRELIIRTLAGEGLVIDACSTASEAGDRFASQRHSIVLTDWTMKDGMQGDELIKEIRRKAKDLDHFVYVIMVTGSVTSGLKRALFSGADEFITKAQISTELLLRVRAGRRIVESVNRISGLSAQLERSSTEIAGSVETVGTSDPYQEVIKRVTTASKSDAAVLLYGESGSGKGHIARLIHKNSRRSEGPFIKLNCSAIPEELFESELFGHEIGAFSGAVKRRLGALEMANGGTLFLDEIGDLPRKLQPKLNVVLDEEDGEKVKKFKRVGGNEDVTSDFRLICASLWSLEQRERKISRPFREDLLWRIKTVTVTVPPLREHPSDIRTIAEYYLQKYMKTNGKDIKGITAEGYKYLTRCDWPGNIRQLQHVIERAVIMATDGEWLNVWSLRCDAQDSADSRMVAQPRTKRAEIDAPENTGKISVTPAPGPQEIVEQTERAPAMKNSPVADDGEYHWQLQMWAPFLKLDATREFLAASTESARQTCLRQLGLSKAQMYRNCKTAMCAQYLIENGIRELTTDVNFSEIASYVSERLPKAFRCTEGNIQDSCKPLWKK